MQLRESERQIWGWVLRGVEVPRVGWFWSRYLDAVTVIVMARGPRWSRRMVMGRPVGAWVMAVLGCAVGCGVVGAISVHE